MSYITKPWKPKEKIDLKTEWTLDFTFEINNDYGLMNQMMFQSEDELKPKIDKWRKILQTELEENSFGDSTFVVCKTMEAAIDNLENLIKFRKEVLPNLTWEEKFEIDKEADLAVLKVIMINEYQVEQSRKEREKKKEMGVYHKEIPRPDLTKR